MKTCITCNKSLLLNNFYKSSKYYSSKCKTCHKAYSATWRKSNPDKAKIYDKRKNRKQWQKQKQDADYMLKKAKYRKSNRQTYIDRATAWNKENKDKTRVYLINSISKRRTVLGGGESYKILTKEINRLLSYPCYFCGSNQDITLDHIIPISRGGNHSIGNLQTLCRSCNSTKKDKLIIEYKYWTIHAKKRKR